MNVHEISCFKQKWFITKVLTTGHLQYISSSGFKKKKDTRWPSNVTGHSSLIVKIYITHGETKIEFQMRLLMEIKFEKTINRSKEFRFSFVQILRMPWQHMQTFLVLSVFLR